jgi:NADH-quinone oxidoreductase subunit F
MTHVLLRHRDIPDINKIDVYKANGGFKAFEQAVKMKPDRSHRSGQRLPGCAAAAAPDSPPGSSGLSWIIKTGPITWLPMRMNPSRGLSKIARSWKSNPFQFIEGVAISSYAVGAQAAYIYLPR